MTMVGGYSASAEGTNPSGPTSALVTVALEVPTAVPVSDRPRGVAVPVAETGGDDVYEEGEDPEIEALFEEAGGFAPVAEEGVPPGDVVQPGILLRCFCFVGALSQFSLCFNSLIFAADPEKGAPQSPPPSAAILSPSRRVERISVK